VSHARGSKGPCQGLRWLPTADVFVGPDLARTRSRAASYAAVGTAIATISPSRSNRARCSASFASVFTRSPEGRCNFDGAATTHGTPAASRNRHNPKPVGPAS